MASKMQDANTIKELCKKRYDRAYKSYLEVNEHCVNDMKRLDDKKLEVWKSFGEFLDVFERIKNRPELTGNVEKERIRLTKVELEDLKLQMNLIQNATVVLSGAAVGATAGTVGATTILGGIGLSAFAACGVAEGIAITTSMAEVTIALYGASAVFWPAAVIATAAVATGALFGYVQGNKKLEEAKDTEEQTDIACMSFKKANDYLERLDRITVSAMETINNIFSFYYLKLKELEKVVNMKDNYCDFSDEEKWLLEAVTILVAILKKMIQTPLLNKKGLMSGKEQESTNYKSQMQSDEGVPDEINDAEVAMLIDNGNKELESIKIHFNNTTSSIDNISKSFEIIDIHSAEELTGSRYVGKMIRFHSQIIIQGKEIEFKDCKVVFTANGRIILQGTCAGFKGCSFCNESNKNDVEIQIGNRSKTEVVNCKFDKGDTAGNISFIAKNCDRAEVILSESTIKGMTTPFLTAESCHIKCFIDNCVFESFRGTAIRLISCTQSADDCVIKNTKFNDFGTSHHTDKDTAIFQAEYVAFHMEQCEFENSQIIAVGGSTLDEAHYFEKCSFKTIWSGENYSGSDGRMYYDSFTIRFEGGMNTLRECAFEDTSSLYLGCIGAFGNVPTSIQKCMFFNCRGFFYLLGAELIDSVFAGCSNYRKKQNKTDSDDIFARVFATMADNINYSIVNIQGMAGKKAMRSLSEVSGCSFIDCEGENYIIEPSNTMSKREVSASINACLFQNCMTESGEMYSTDTKGWSGAILKNTATASGNKVIAARKCGESRHLSKKNYDIRAILRDLECETSSLRGK